MRLIPAVTPFLDICSKKTREINVEMLVFLLPTVFGAVVKRETEVVICLVNLGVSKC